MNKFKKLLVLAVSAVSVETAAIAVETTATSTITAGGSADFAPGQGLRFNFRGVELQKVFDYMSEAASFVIQLKPGVELTNKVDIWSDQPLSKAEAVAMLKQVLSDYGYAVASNGRLLTVIRSSDAPRGYSPVRLGNKAEDIPLNAEIVTQVIPVRSLNPVELAKVLAPLLPNGTVPSVDESANALVITDTQANIHRAVEIITALDSVSASANTLKVFPLRYADAKSLAALIKELFAAPDTSARNGRGNSPLIRFPGFGGQRGASAISSAADGDVGQAPSSRVAAVADEYGNALIISAPDALLPAIEKLVESVDQPVQDITEFRVFPLENCDAGDLADELMSLFPEDTNSSSANRGAVQFPGQGGRGGTTGGTRQGAAGEVTSASERAKKLGRVLAVPDRRTGSVMVSAAKSLMPQIAGIIEHLDRIDFGHQRVHVINVHYADPFEVQQIFSELGISSNVVVNGASGQDPFEMRKNALFTSFFSGGTSSGMGSTFGTSRTSSAAGR